MSKLTTSEEMFAHVEAWKESGLSQKAYCHEHMIAYHLFPYWTKRYRMKHGEGQEKKGFVSVEVSNPGISAPLMELSGPGGLSLKFYQQPDVSFLKSLLS